MSEYVTQDEDDEPGSGGARVRKLRKHVLRLNNADQSETERQTGAHKTERQSGGHKLRKHVLRQESYEDRSPQFYFDPSDIIRSADVGGCRGVVSTRRAASLDQYLDMNCSYKDLV